MAPKRYWDEDGYYQRPASQNHRGRAARAGRVTYWDTVRPQAHYRRLSAMWATL